MSPDYYLILCTIWRAYEAYSESGVLWHLPHSLSNTEIAQDILSTTEQRIKGDGAMVMLDEATHTCSSDTTPTEDLDRVSGSELSCAGGMHLQEGNLACELAGHLSIGLREGPELEWSLQIKRKKDVPSWSFGKLCSPTTPASFPLGRSYPPPCAE